MELVPHLRKILGNDNVIASDIKALPRDAVEMSDGPFVYCDVYVFHRITDAAQSVELKGALPGIRFLLLSSFFTCRVL